jgi:hypothetical protein|uniref:Uncharacterized protein n=1 Tax=Myoviridae sp. ctshb19 TaxID=2825194 RepID=A0A8S5UGE0_9CAUD|nr:MAG TPA: hypothetical protein [Myoviridae sp. ctshb19]
MSHYTQVVQVKRNTEGSICIGGITDPKDPLYLSPYLTLPGMLSVSRLVEKLAFRRAERNPEHWYGSSHLIDKSHLNPESGARFDLLLEIPIKVQPPFVDLLPCGTYGTHDGHFTAYILYTDACVQEKISGIEFTGQYLLDWLRHENESLWRQVQHGIGKYKLGSNDPNI